MKTALLLIGILLACGCVSQQATQTIKIGAILPLTGSDLAEPSEAFRDGMIIAADDINSKGGVDGKKLELVIEDDQMKYTQTTSAALKLINVDKVGSVVTATYDEAATTSQVFEDAKVPLVVLWDSNPRLDDMGNYVFAIGPWTPSSGERTAEFSYNDLGARKVVIINNLWQWSIDVSGFYKTRFESLGGNVTDVISVDLSSSNDYRSAIAKALSYNPDIIYAPIADGFSTFFIQMKELGSNKPLVTSDIITDNVILTSKNSTEGVYQSFVMDPQNRPETQQMIQLYENKFGKPPKNVLFTAWGYDAVMVIVEASQGAAAGEQIAANIYKIKGLKGASKDISFNENGSSPTIPDIVVVKDGKLEIVK